MILSALRDLGQITTGSTPSTKDAALYGGDLPFITPADLGSSVEITAGSRTLSSKGAAVARVLPSGTVLVCCIGTVGKVGIAGLPVATNQQINAITFDPAKVHPRFGLYACQTLGPQLAKVVSSTTLPIVSKSKFAALMIPVPPLDEQRRIAAILDKVDELRTKRRQALTQVDALTQSIFYSMFGDPISNPMAWPVVSVGDALESAKYGSSEKAALAGPTPVLRMNNLTYGGQLDLSQMKYLTGDVDEKYLLRPGDVLFNRTNSAELVGKTAVFTGPEPMAYAGYLVRLRTNVRCRPHFLGTFMNLPSTKKTLRSMCKSIVGMANINAREVQTIKMPLPPVDEQNAFEARVIAIRHLKDHHHAQLRELDNLFAALQHRAFRGEL